MRPGRKFSTKPSPPAERRAGFRVRTQSGCMDREGTSAGPPLFGRQLTELAILATAREHDQPYEWSLHEMEALAVGLDPAVIDVVRHRKPPAGLGDKETFIIQASREIFELHRLSSDSYAKRV